MLTRYGTHLGHESDCFLQCLGPVRAGGRFCQRAQERERLVDAVSFRQHSPQGDGNTQFPRHDSL